MKINMQAYMLHRLKNLFFCSLIISLIIWKELIAVQTLVELPTCNTKRWWYPVSILFVIKHIASCMLRFTKKYILQYTVIAGIPKC